jgi:stage V sporulation protein B
VSIDPKTTKIGRAAIYIYIETFVSLILGYIFWILMSRFGNPEIIGISAAVITFSGILSVISNFGIPTGIQRFLGKSFATFSRPEIKIYVLSSLLIITIAIGIIVILSLIFSNYFLSVFKVDKQYLYITLFLMICTTYPTLFRGIIVSSLQTKILTLSMTLSATLKIILGIFFMIWGFGAFGLIISYTINQLAVSIILGIYIISVFHKSRAESENLVGNKDTLLIKKLKEIFSSSIVNWVPLVITTIGSQLGNIFIYGTNGSKDAGLFFMSLTIVTGITSVMYSLFTISFPAMSAMEDGRKRFTANTIRLSLIMAIPFTSSLIFYSRDILGLLGTDYTPAYRILDILLLSMVPTAIQYGITSLVYSYGKYRQVLLLGLTTSIPRITLYFILVPVFGSIGGAIAFTVGVLIGFISSIIVARENGSTIEWRNTLLILTIPMVISLILYEMNIYYIFGILLNLIFSYIIMYYFKLILIADVKYFVRLLPSPSQRAIFSLIKKINNRR